MKLSFRNFTLIIISLWVLGTGLFLAWTTSATTDEDIHVASAYLAIKRHEFRFDPEHPYLFKAMTAAPLLLLKLNLPADDQQLWQAGYPHMYDSWQEARRWADEWFFTSGNNADLMLFLARIPTVICFWLLCLLVYYLGKQWFSERIGILAATLTAFNPTLIAHGHLANNDVPAALAFLATVWALWAYWKKPTLKQAAILGIVFGLAEITKFSLLILVPIVFIWLLYTAISQKKSWKVWLGHSFLVAFLCWIIIWLGYLGPYTLWIGTAFQLRGPSVPTQANSIPQELLDRVLYIRYVLPVDYVKGASLIAGSSYTGRETYVLGISRHGGLWYYFPVIYFFKTQVAGLLMLLIALWAGFRSNLLKPKSWSPQSRLILLATSVFILVSIINKLNIGIRHVAPMMPFASLGMALGLDYVIRQKTKIREYRGLLLALYIIPIAFWFPHFLNYGNVLVIPQAKAWKYYNDSNIDWGQQAKELVTYTHDHFPNEKPYVEFRWNPYILSYYGLDYYKLDSHNWPPSGSLVIVTATQLSSPDFAKFRDIDTIGHISNTTFFYRMP